MGIQYRFTKESKRCVTENDLKIAYNLRYKMKAFLSSVRTMKSDVIKCIYRPSPIDPNLSLGKFLSSFNSESKKNRPLFYAIEQDHLEADVTFHYNAELAAEAKRVIETLPLVVKEQFGGATAAEWFKPDTWKNLEHYTIVPLDPLNKSNGCRISQHEGDSWENLDEEFEMSQGPNMEMALDENNDMVISNFGLYLLEGTPSSHQLGDDGASTWTDGHNSAEQFSESTPLSTLTPSTPSPASPVMNLMKLMRRLGCSEQVANILNSNLSEEEQLLQLQIIDKSNQNSQQQLYEQQGNEKSNHEVGQPKD
jgi:hypothetical protein